jgi:hypothetical protein
MSYPSQCHKCVRCKTVCVSTNKARCKPAVRANADITIQNDEWNGCEESRYETGEGRSPLYAHLRACQDKAGRSYKTGY